MMYGPQDAAHDTGAEMLSEINMTPLVDVMLVLLIVFIVTIPVMRQAVGVELPQTTAQATTRPQALRLTVTSTGTYKLNDLPMTDAGLPVALRAAALQSPSPELHIYADRAVRHEHVAQAMAWAQEAGLRKIGFVSDPRR